MRLDVRNEVCKLDAQQGGRISPEPECHTKSQSKEDSKMARTRNKVVLEGLAKIRIMTDSEGRTWLCTEVDEASAQGLKAALGSFVDDLCAANEPALSNMAEEMRKA